MKKLLTVLFLIMVALTTLSIPFGLILAIWIGVVGIKICLTGVLLMLVWSFIALEIKNK